jgi:C-terminal processing protease CtpA/Prc
LAESRNTQLGIVLNGLTIESMIIGSPSQHSKQLAIGDVIMKIDGIVATQTNVRSLLIGSDVPGTAVILSVLKLRSQVRLIDIHDTS